MATQRNVATSAISKKAADATELPIFVSHSHHDDAFCRTLVGFLQEQLPNADVFFAEESIHIGEAWVERIQKEVIRRPIFVVILSQHSVIADWVREETNLALIYEIKDRAARRVIPVQIEPCDVDKLAALLRNRQSITLSKDTHDPAWGKLLAVVRGDEALPEQKDPGEMALERALRARDAFEAALAADTAHRGELWGRAATALRLATIMSENAQDASLWGEYGQALVNSGIDSIQVGRLQEGEAEIKDGLEKLDIALGINQYRTDLWRFKAHTLAVQLGEVSAARQAWDSALARTKDPQATLDILDEEYTALQGTQHSRLVLEVIELALTVEPDSAVWLSRRLQVLMDLGRSKEALHQVRDLTDRPGADNTSMVQLLLICAKLAMAVEGNVEEASAAVNRAESLAPGNTQVNQVRQEVSIPLARFPGMLRALGFSGKVTEFITPPLCFVPPGPFPMGSTPQQKVYNQEPRPNELPLHSVNLPGFYIAKYPVTVAEYACAVRAGVVREPALGSWSNVPVDWQRQLRTPDHPVVCVTWKEAVTYCVWLTELTGKRWRLPTEAEWEKCARGTDGRIYPWGNEVDPRRCTSSDITRPPLPDGSMPTTTAVNLYGARGASPYGVEDLVGNVSEWTSSLDRPYPYRADDGREDLNAPGHRILRGGSWGDNMYYVRAAHRLEVVPPEAADNGAGFRVVCETDLSQA